MPLLLEMAAEETAPAVKLLNDGKIKLRHSPAAQQKLFDKIPASLKGKLKTSVKQLSQAELKGDISDNLESLVGRTSRQMFMAGIFSTNPLKGLPYMLAKRRKAKQGQAKK